MSLYKRILFVCNTNLVRSPLAAAFLHGAEVGDLRIAAESAGVFAGRRSELLYRPFLELARQHNLDLSEHQTRSIDLVDFSAFQVLVVFDQESYLHTKQLVGSRWSRPIYGFSEFIQEPIHSDIPDPLQNEISFEEVFRLIKIGCDEILTKIKKL